MRTLFEIQRNQITEREIAGSIAVVSGKTIITINDPVIFGRSLTKPFQMKAIQKVLADKLDWKQKAISLASHNGELDQVDVARSILRDDEQAHLALLPSPALGGRKATPSIWLNPCSGKHSAILLACRLNSWSLDGYTDLDHPYNKAYLKVLELRLGVSVADRTSAPDGCLLPTYAMSVSELARLFSTLADEKDNDWIWEAAHRHPELIGGEGRLDTRILRSHTNTFAKEGADGLLGLAIRSGETSIGITIKIANGHDPASADRVAHAILQALEVPYPAPAPPAGQQVRFTADFESFIQKLKMI